VEEAARLSLVVDVASEGMATNGSLLELAGDGKNLGRVTRAIMDMVAASFEVHPMRHATTDEVRRRGDICIDVFKRLRGELHWSLDRCLDKIPEYLGAQLSGIDWRPSARTIWTPSETAKETVQ
jgi:hypothetical protein